MNYFNTEVSTSKQKKFPLVTFVDTPGLVDGDMNYPFDVNDGILWLGGFVYLIFVFFDPIGQALCKRTLNVVEALSKAGHGGRMRFYLSKADEAGHESDRQRVMMQIVQELCKRPGLNRTGFDMPTIYVPNPNKQVRCVNQIDEVCRDVEKTINQTIQNTLNSLERDCDHIGTLVDEAIAKDNKARASNFKAYVRGSFLYLAFLSLPLALLLSLVLGLVGEKLVRDMVGKQGAELITLYTAPVRTFWSGLPSDYQVWAAGGLILLIFVLLTLARWASRTSTTLSRRQKRSLLDKQEYVQNVVKAKKGALYSEYLQQTVSEQDL